MAIAASPTSQMPRVRGGDDGNAGGLFQFLLGGDHYIVQFDDLPFALPIGTTVLDALLGSLLRFQGG
ncbi:hypothetical protein ACE0DR_09130 [Azotobacter sp. CWF10]